MYKKKNKRLLRALCGHWHYNSKKIKEAQKLKSIKKVINLLFYLKMKKKFKKIN